MAKLPRTGRASSPVRLPKTTRKLANSRAPASPTPTRQTDRSKLFIDRLENAGPTLFSGAPGKRLTSVKQHLARLIGRLEFQNRLELSYGIFKVLVQCCDGNQALSRSSTTRRLVSIGSRSFVQTVRGGCRRSDNILKESYSINASTTESPKDLWRGGARASRGIAKAWRITVPAPG